MQLNNPTRLAIRGSLARNNEGYGRRSQDNLLPLYDDTSSPSHAGSSSARDDENESQPKSPQGVTIEPFTVEGFNLELPITIYGRLKTVALNCVQQLRTVAKNWQLYFRPRLRRGFGNRPRASRCFMYLITGYLLFLGVVHLLGNILDVLEAQYPDDLDWIIHHWGLSGEVTEGFGHWPTDATGDIHPVNCHSHNDYWRRVPLYAAVHAGCTGAEADIWLVNDQLYVGHSKGSLTPNRTLQNLYIKPLLQLVEKQNPPIRYHPAEDYPLYPANGELLNGIFDIDPTQTFVLLIDFKTSNPALWWELVSQLAPLREMGYLTYFNGSALIENPITIVGTGDAPFDLLTANSTYRDVFFDAPLEEMADLSSQWPNPNRAQDPTRGHHSRGAITSDKSGIQRTTAIAESNERALDQPSTPDNNSATRYNPFNSYYASTSFTKSVGHVFGSRLTQEQLQLIRGQIRGAHQRGLKVRYWDLPTWPIGLRNHIWHILMREGVDMLNVDDLRHATGWDWRRRKGWWY